MRFKIAVILCLFCVLPFFLDAPRAQARKDPFPGLMDFLEKQYASPFQVVGKVYEVSGDRLLFSKTDIPLEVGQQLRICEHKPGVSQALQSRVAWVQVEALFADKVLARITGGTASAIKAKDLALTPAAPVIYLYTNITGKQGFDHYRQLLTALLNARFQVKEVTGDTIAGKPESSDALLRLEWEAGQLVCGLTRLEDGTLLYSETLPYPESVQTQFSSGHLLAQTVYLPARTPAAPLAQPSAVPKASRLAIAEPHVQTPKPSSMPVRAPAAPSIQPPPVTEESDSEPAGPSFQTSKPIERTEFHKLSEPFLRVQSCDLEGDGNDELAFLSQEAVVIYGFETGQLIRKLSHRFDKDNYFPIHLHAVDIDGRKGDELLVTLAEPSQTLEKKDSRLCSMILTLQKATLHPLVKSWPYYLRVIRDRHGRSVALAQSRGDYEPYTGPISLLRWNSTHKTVEQGGPYKPARGVYSIYQFNLVPEDPQRVMILEPNNNLNGYFAPEETLEATGIRNYGDFHELAYPIKLEKAEIIGGFDTKTFREIYAPRRFELRPAFDGQSFIIYKERTGSGGIIKGTVKKILTSRGIDQVAGVKWAGQQIVETWKSKELSKNILDFTFSQDSDRILVLYEEEKGCALEALH
ncbi:MAG: hypothetical protein JRE10_11735 [Deltaproteobacteria bacterium]|nr:hypothetical protein [Deltaproteobacteria bacterium]